MNKSISLCSSCNSLNCFINRFATPEWKKKLEVIKSFYVYKKSKIIFREGDPVFGIYFLYNGKIKIYNSGPKNRQQIVRLAGSGDIFGHRGFGKKMIYPISAATLEDSEACFIPYENFLEALENNPQLVINLMLFYADELKRAEYKLRSLSQMNVKQKVAEALLTIRGIYGTVKKDGQEVLNLSLTRQDMADITGSSLEEVIRTISQFNKEGMIAITGKEIAIVNEQKLFELVKDFNNLLLP